jgi:hypothetical protein
MDEQKYHNETVFWTSRKFFILYKILTETVGPLTFYLNQSVGGPGWTVLNVNNLKKTVVIDNPHLATLVMLKLK